MSIRLLIALICSGLLINADAFAKDALSSVQIVDGITQQRPPNTPGGNWKAVCVEFSRKTLHHPNDNRLGAV